MSTTSTELASEPTLQEAELELRRLLLLVTQQRQVVAGASQREQQAMREARAHAEDPDWWKAQENGGVVCSQFYKPELQRDPPPPEPRPPSAASFGGQFPTPAPTPEPADGAKIGGGGAFVIGGVGDGVDGGAKPPVTVQHSNLNAAMRAILAAGGSDESEQAIVADHLVTANLMGHDSHGVQMLPLYIAALLRGEITANNHIRPQGDDGVSALITVDGAHGYGQVMGDEATKLAIARCKASGVAVLALRRPHHIGRVGTYAEMAAAEGLVYISFASVYSAVVAPFGGSDARTGTNPFTCALPTAEGAAGPLLADFATAVIANGKLQNLMMQGVDAPDGFVLDSDGNPSNDPSVTWREPKGCILPMGLHKGGALQYVCEALAAAVSGAGTIATANPTRAIRSVNNMLAIFLDPAKLGTPRMAAEDIDESKLGEGNGKAFEDASTLPKDLAEFERYMRASPPANNEQPILLPGDPERIAMAARKESGVEIAGNTWEQILKAAESVGIARAEIEALSGLPISAAPAAAAAAEGAAGADGEAAQAGGAAAADGGGPLDPLAAAVAANGAAALTEVAPAPAAEAAEGEGEGGE